MTVARLAIAASFAASAQTATAETGAAEQDVWHMLSQIGIEEIITDTSYEVRKSFPVEMQGEMQVEITGYAVPALPGEKIKELLLVSDMGVCPLCGNADHGASLQIALNDPIETFDESRRMTLRGTLKRVTDPETWQAAILEGAELIVE